MRSTVETTAQNPSAPISRMEPEHPGGRAPLKRGPYRAPAARPPEGDVRPSRVLAENIRAYRLLRDITQDDLAARMTRLGHGWSRSAVSAAEGRRRGVTIDEVFGLAINFEVAVGCLLDPSGPDCSRTLGLDVGLRRVGHSSELPSQLGRLFAWSRAVIRLVDHDSGTIDIDIVSDAATPA